MTNKHTLRIFDEDLKALSDELVNLSRQVGEELAAALQALMQGDPAADDLQDRINTHTTRTLARQQAMADDLRAILAAARIGSMLQRVTEAYASHDAQLANVAWSDDAELDAVYAKLFEHLLGRMREESAYVADGTQLLFIAKGLERAGDHVTDIAEEVYLMVTGKPLQGPRPKVDEADANPPD
jgi:phosphate transport system protein